jgi:hypothetical protein
MWTTKLRSLENTPKWEVAGSLGKPKCKEIATAMQNERVVG